MIYLQQTEIQDMLFEIIDYAQTADSYQFNYICTWKDYKFYKGKFRSFKLLVRALSDAAERMFKKYCNSVSFGKEEDPTKLIAFHQMQEIIQFYVTEADTLADMLSEYRAYLNSGHFLNSFLGQHRHSRDLYDFRK